MLKIEVPDRTTLRDPLDYVALWKKLRTIAETLPTISHLKEVYLLAIKYVASGQLEISCQDGNSFEIPGNCFESGFGYDEAGYIRRYLYTKTASNGELLPLHRLSDIRRLQLIFVLMLVWQFHQSQRQEVA
ncbi:MAG: hypothetical protein AAGD92_16050 [Pseudomonadota bacterium]